MIRNPAKVSNEAIFNHWPFITFTKIIAFEVHALWEILWRNSWSFVKWLWYYQWDILYLLRMKASDFVISWGLPWHGYILYHTVIIQLLKHPPFPEKFIIVFQAIQHPHLKLLFQYPNTYTLWNSNGDHQTSTSLRQSLRSSNEVAKCVLAFGSLCKARMGVCLTWQDSGESLATQD